ncbi:MAG: PatB family C-S lyase [Chloroflexi bacterium]|nr:PatB family C-S lyase [Chloroflexota bacterium]
MAYNFDQSIDRRHSDSVKWRVFDDDVLPLWVADMDFVSPEPVVRALTERVAHGVFGYGVEPKELRELLVTRLRDLYDWIVVPEAIVFVPGVVVGFNAACRAIAAPGDGILVQTPVYGPILDVPRNFGMTRDEMELTCGPNGRYTVDLDRMAATITDRTRAFVLCSPHNPVGRVFEQTELAAMADLCLKRDLTIISDEIHCDLVFSGYRHTPIAALAPEIESRTITVMAPSKTYNIAGLGCSFAVIPNPDLRKRYQSASKDLVPHVDLLAFTAALAAYRDGGPWLADCLRYLEGNRDIVAGFVAQRLPGITMSPMEGTYLAWLDCRQADLPDTPAQFFLKQARVAMNDGDWFGRGGEGFVRLNFGCPRATLETALERMEKALIVMRDA